MSCRKAYQLSPFSIDDNGRLAATETRLDGLHPLPQTESLQSVCIRRELRCLLLAAGRGRTESTLLVTTAVWSGTPLLHGAPRSSHTSGIASTREGAVVGFKYHCLWQIGTLDGTLLHCVLTIISTST